MSIHVAKKDGSSKTFRPQGSSSVFSLMKTLVVFYLGCKIGGGETV